ncbi:MAG: hypothetical protein HY200_00200 [Nitrospirae bacterium]|nr:hypothetical protein [Nitrospirota bacterium]MBI3593358.1 hypothetical protein [Nitrospirota bacterium]
MWLKIKILLFYTIVIDSYVYFFGKNDPLAPFYGLLFAAMIFVPGYFCVKKIKLYIERRGS